LRGLRLLLRIGRKTDGHQHSRRQEGGHGTNRHEILPKKPFVKEGRLPRRLQREGQSAAFAFPSVQNLSYALRAVSLRFGKAACNRRRGEHDLSPQWVALIVKAYAARLRLDPGAFSGRNLRLVTGIDSQTGTPITSMKRSQGIRLNVARSEPPRWNNQKSGLSARGTSESFR
jgi:hypothetical protein